MATSKEYAYYLKGNKIAIVEKASSVSAGTEILNDDGSSTGTFKRAYGDLEWKSPTSDIAKGLEIEFTYIRDYWMSSARHIGWNIISTTDERNTSAYSPAYGEINGYLTFFFPAIVANNGVLDMSILNVSGRNILVHNHLFSGKHGIKVASAQGYIQTTTKWNSGLNKFEADDHGPNPVFNATETILQSGATSFNHGFSAGDYIFNVTAMVNTDNQGLFRIAELSSDGTTVTVDKNYYSDTTTSGDLASVDAALQGETFTGGNLFMPQVLLSQGAYVDTTAVNFMEDETFEIDFPNYLCKAIVYYLKGKQLEDAMEIEGSEYFMRKFRKQVEKNASSKISTHRNIQGFRGMR